MACQLHSVDFVAKDNCDNGNLKIVELKTIANDATSVVSFKNQRELKWSLHYKNQTLLVQKRKQNPPVRSCRFLDWVT